MDSNVPIEKKKQKLTTREWIFIIVILSLVQLFIHVVSYRFGNSPSALGYVSFAGTLVSIMLGLIAIIYSFVQSISQSTNVIEIREQVERLIVAGGEISESGRIIHSASQEVSELVGDLASKVTENTSATKEVFGSFKALTSESFSVIDGASGAGGVTDETGSEEVRSVTESARIIVTLMILCVRESAKRNYSVEQAKKELLAKLAIKFGMEVAFLSGSFYGVLFALEVEGLVVIGEGEEGEMQFEVTDRFTERANSLIPDTVSGDDKHFKGFWLVINEMDS